MFISVNYKESPFATVSHVICHCCASPVTPLIHLILFKQPKPAFNLFQEASRSDGAEKDNCTSRRSSLNR